MPSAQSHLIRLRSKRTALAAALALLIGSPAPAVTLLESEDTLYNLNLLTFFHIDFADQISGEDQPGAPQQVQGFEEARLVGHFSSQLGTRWSAFMEVEGTATRDNSTLRVERVVAKYQIDNVSQLSVGRFHSPVGYWNQYYHHGRWLQVSKDRPLQTEFGGTFLPAHHWGAMYERSFRKGEKIIDLDLSVGGGRDEDIALADLDFHDELGLKHGGESAGNGPHLDSNWSVMAQINIKPSDRLGSAFGGSFWVGDLEGEAGDFQERILTAHINHLSDTAAL